MALSSMTSTVLFSMARPARLPSQAAASRSAAVKGMVGISTLVISGLSRAVVIVEAAEKSGR
jgi:hypothetical protein